eukprot:gb/GECG01009443.1/.p1 GENE.gb/GECG01009443.1/~~gb/GECG01009443.1/.p1  ORF type:complete len:1400 (+),score=179.60 gb/GECG01009443.1/:1-4200(+)
MSASLQGRGFRFSIDRGGTFTDVYADIPVKDSSPNNDDGVQYKHRVMKLLSVDPDNYEDAPREAIRRILEQETGERIPKDMPIPTKDIERIRMGTTVATNALLERKGERCAFLVTSGFADILHIGNQSRPEIFDLEIKIPGLLYEEVVEVDERVMLMDAPHAEDDVAQVSEKEGDSTLGERQTRGVTNQRVLVRKSPDRNVVEQQLKALLNKGIRSIAVAFMHSYTYPEHEMLVGQIARELGFKQISLSHEVMPMVKIVPRGFTSCADAYLSPVIRDYIDSFCSGFDDSIGNVDLSFMQSDGGLAPVTKFSGHKAILSGPAAGVVGYAETTQQIAQDAIRASKEGWFSPSHLPPLKGGAASENISDCVSVVGFDMGGTSTDVSRFDGSFEHVFETNTAGVTIQAPQLDINTVAAGGGSRLFFRSGMFVVGPESAGAHPGPVCYRKGGHLAVTDANLQLGRIQPQHFPKIFGPRENEALDAEATQKAFERLTEEVNKEENADLSADYPKHRNVDDVAFGFIQVANEAMCRPIRALTQMKGYDISKHCLACFGGAGGQHACAMAKSLGVRSVVVHRYSGILSAYGLALADVVNEEQSPCHAIFATPAEEGSKEPTERVSSQTLDEIVPKLVGISESAINNMKSNSFVSKSIDLELFLNLRYSGTDNAMMTKIQFGNSRERVSAVQVENEDFYKQLRQRLPSCVDVFSTQYKREYGFSLPDRSIEVDDVRVRVIGRSPIRTALELAQSNPVASERPAPLECQNVYFEGQRVKTAIYSMQHLQRGHTVSGPAILIDKTSTTVVEPHCTAYVLDGCDIFIAIADDSATAESERAGGEIHCDPIQLSIFGHRFMSIAEQMGRTLQRTSISVNIKERLDFSCAIFGPDGGLVANAPHIPVHLGAMQEAIRYQMKHWNNAEDPLKPGDVLISNHPQLAGGSHLPDITVMTPVFHGDRIVFFVASRGHHADIGGIAPGSMPPLSKYLVEEGASIVAFKLVRNNKFEENGITDLLMAPGKSGVPGCAGCRNLKDVLSDLKAQVAANEQGVKLMHSLIGEYSLRVVHAYMNFIQENAETAVRDMLKKFSTDRGLLEKDKVVAHDLMDDGSDINLTIHIDRNDGSATFDFEGTSAEVYGNTNAPPAVTYSAIIYSLRCLVGMDIPLNEGCLKPVTVNIPESCILNPSAEAAVVGGNVLTSQRVVDVVLKAFKAAAASQGCMNNLTFGNDRMGYYETIAGGAGAGPSWSGRSGVHTHMTNTRITDPEIFEQRYPVLLHQFRLRQGSGGKGLYTGGDGVVREIEFRAPLIVSILSERRVLAPYGLEGGEDGKRGKNYLTLCSSQRTISLGGKNTVRVQCGDRLLLFTPGGGGFGSEGTAHADMNLQTETEVEYPQRRHGGGSLAKFKATQESA